MDGWKTGLLVLCLALAGTGAADEISIRFSTHDIQIIKSYYSGARDAQDEAPRGGSHGRHGHKHLPRGIAKNLARGKPLPPGIAKQQLPAPLTVLLPPPPVGYERLVVDGKVLLVEIATGVVRDVLTDALFHR